MQFSHLLLLVAIFHEILILVATRLKELSFNSVLTSCDSKILLIQSTLQFYEGAGSVDCEEWIMTLEVDESIKLSPNLCHICSSEVDSGPHSTNRTFGHRRVCIMNTSILAHSEVRVVLKVGKEGKGNLSTHLKVELQVPCTDRAPPELPNASQWRVHEDFWAECFWGAYPMIVSSARRLNAPPYPQHIPSIRPLDIPVFVLSLPSRPDRRRHAAALLRAAGFPPPTFPPVRAAAADAEALVAQGRVSRAARA